MSKELVIYQSKYGATKQYANWLKDELGCSLCTAKEVTPKLLEGFDTIIFGGPLYAGGISGISCITKNWEIIKNKNLCVFTVGLTDPDLTERFTTIINGAFTQEQKDKVHVFHLRGKIDYSKLSFLHKTMMGMLVKGLKKKAEKEELSDEDKEMINTYGKQMDFSKKSTLNPIIEQVKKFCNQIK